MTQSLHHAVAAIAETLSRSLEASEWVLRVDDDQMLSFLGEIDASTSMRLATQLGDLREAADERYYPIVFSCQKGEMNVAVAGLDVGPNVDEKKLDDLDVIFAVDEQFEAEDGGDNRYLFGFPGQNLPVDNLAAISADTAEGACARFLAGRMDFSGIEAVPTDLDPKLAKLTMRRSHDWRQYDVMGLIARVAPVIDREIDRRIVGESSPSPEM